MRFLKPLGIELSGKEIDELLDRCEVPKDGLFDVMIGNQTFSSSRAEQFNLVHAWREGGLRAGSTERVKAEYHRLIAEFGAGG